ncbi:hypothetical protein DNTS_010825 [Danionella cerebrum]|uniref:Ig-like domain-containing protein n=1 Tax=Danionella cerebrum TaxID=2873325 RepID=A0A553QHL8_9TELE|nr:hypothetical protein DNTS_010825 [Danionella translucida]
MGLPIGFILGMLLNLAHRGEMQDLEKRDLILNQTVEGIIGEEVYLHCLYTGESTIQFSSWNRLDSAMKAKKMAGYSYINGFFKKDHFDMPSSVTNLTVRVNVTSLDLEGEYMCVFNSEEDETKGQTFLSVIARPDIAITLKEEIMNRSLYHAVTCSASGAKPEAIITWQIAGNSPRDDIFSVTTTRAAHPNGTITSISVLLFPLVLNNESTVTCVVQHPAFTEPKRANIEVDTFDSPVVSMETVLMHEGDFQEVTCKATGGKPHPNITWKLPKQLNNPIQLLQTNITQNNSVISSFRFPTELYEGQNVSCSFGYTFLPFLTTRTVTLPVYSESLKEGQPLPEDVIVVDDNLFIRGPVDLDHGGLYQCRASYRKHIVYLEFTIQVIPKPLLPVTFPPNITVDVAENLNYIRIQCLASDAVPAANVSWILPPEINSTVQSDVTYSNSSYTARSVLTVPACITRKYSIACIVEHPDFMQKQVRQTTLPVCEAPSVTLQWSSEWQSGVALARLECTAETHSPAVLVGISWVAQCHGIDSGSSEFIMSQANFRTSQTGVVQSVARVSVYSLTGCTVSCAVEQEGFEEPVNKSMVIPALGPSSIRVMVAEVENVQIWQAVCEYSGEGLKPNISWIVPDEDAEGQATVEFVYNGTRVEISSTFEFELSMYEGKDLICLVQSQFGQDQRRRIRVPQYSISSVEVLNKTLVHRRSRGQHEHRLELEENLSNQKIVLRANGNAPSYKTACYRSDGSAAHTDGMALVFPSPVSDWDAGLYICHVSYHHHKAKVLLQVDVTSEEKQHFIFITICFTSAAAITLVLIIVSCVLCKCGKSDPSQKKTRMERESLSALMQDPRCSERTLSVQPGNYAELAHFSIVFDAKSTV